MPAAPHLERRPSCPGIDGAATRTSSPPPRSDGREFDHRRAGGSTCAIQGDTSAYWVPALFEDGELVHPDATSHDSLFYYRRGGSRGTQVLPFPDDLRMIIGNGRLVATG